MKTAIVTGASRGIGHAVAVELAKRGYNLGICAFRNEEALMKTAEEIRSYGVQVKCYMGDISDSSFVKEMFGDFVKNYSRIDVLVNNAGIAKIGLFTDITDEDWRKICGTNLDSVLWCAREAVKVMVKQKSGRIINISSMWGQVGASCEVLYSTTKGGVDTFTKALAKELAPSKIAVNAVSCGAVDTEMNAQLSWEDRAALCDEIPAGRFAKPSEVGEVVANLCECPEYMTGQIIRVDGAMV